jgi:regulator of sirC expression with transglutaminase-like and TPR domain
MRVGARLDLDLAALALPGHVVGRWPGGWVDLYAGGATLNRIELDLRVRLAGGRDATPWLAAASDKALLRRMARNLTLAYLRRHDAVRATISHALATC